MKKITASFFSEEDFIAIDREIEQLKKEAEKENRLLHDRIEAESNKRLVSLKKAQSIEATKANVKTDNIIGDVQIQMPQLSENSHHAVNASENSACTAAQTDDDLECIKQEMGWLFNRDSHQAPSTDASLGIDPDRSHDLTMRAYQFTLGVIAIAAFAAYFCHVANWMGAAAAGLAYMAVMPKSKWTDILSELPLLAVLIASQFWNEGVLLTIIAVTSALGTRTAKRFLAAD